MPLVRFVIFGKCSILLLLFFSSVEIGNIRSMTRKLKKFSTSGNDGSASWSDLNHDVLFLIMMHMGVFDFIAFSGVCKSWRLLAVSNWNKFMLSKQPMYLYISDRLRNKDCCFEDYERKDYKQRKLKTVIPHSNERRCVGITCGYLIFFGRKTRDFWLVNPFTKKELRFPRFPSDGRTLRTDMRVVLVFSPSLSGWVLVVLAKQYSNRVSFSLAGKQAMWRSISTEFPIYDLHFFKGKIYIINRLNHLWELRLHPEPTLTLCKMKNRPLSNIAYPKFVSSGENFYVRDYFSRDDAFKAVEVDFDEMKWVNSERTIGEYEVFASEFNCDAAIKPDTWAHPGTRYERFNCIQNYCRETKIMWYFPHECLIDNASDMENGALLNILQE